MSTKLMISMLRQANTGSDLLSILDTLVTEDVTETDINQPTLEPIEF